MKLEKLFKMQKELDDRIIKQHGLENKNLLPGTILALQVELAELANEWQGFKHWKVNPQPKPKMLEEYVDGLHFILSIGNELNFVHVCKDLKPIKNKSIIEQFIFINTKVGILLTLHSIPNYLHIVQSFIGLGEMLGFTWQEIEQAYLEKNKVNHLRQTEGY